MYCVMFYFTGTSNNSIQKAEVFSFKELLQGSLNNLILPAI